MIMPAPLVVRLAEGADKLGFILSGSIVTDAGVVLLVRFLRRYPTHADGESQGV